VKNAPNSRVLTPLVAPRHEGEEHEQSAQKPVPIARLSIDHVWSAISKVLTDPRRDPERALPARVQDSPESRWARYIEMTNSQCEADGVTEAASVLPGFSPKVSVVIPAFNRREATQRAVNSALAQTEKSLEVLLVDDGSTDDTAAAYAKPPDRVRYIRKPNGGASSARNVGLRRARGEFIALLDSDDEWLPEKLERQLACAAPAIASRHVHINKDGTRQSKPEVMPSRDIFSDLYAKLALKTSTLLFRRELLDKVGLFNERFPISNDWDFFLRLARETGHEFKVLPEPLAVIHRSHNSISRGNRYHALEHAFTRICSINALLHGSGLVSQDTMVRRAGAKLLELSRAKLAEGGKRAKHTARAHAKDAIRAGLWFEGAIRLMRTLL
jgi:GT2 family glycosyltransferase